MEAYTKHVDTLMDACGSDEFPEDIECLKTFMFDRLFSEQEARYLLGLYIGLIKLHPDFVKQDLIKALSNNNLTNYLVKMHSGNYQSFYSKWFIENKERFM